MSGRRLAVLVAVLVGVAAWALWPAKTLSDEQQVRLVVEQAVDAANARDAATIARALAADFHGGDGLSQGEATLLLARLLRDQREVAITTAKLEVRVTDATHAGFVGTFVMFGRAGGDPVQGRTLALDAALEKRDGAWLITTASWK